MLDSNSTHNMVQVLRDRFGSNAVNVATKKEREARLAGRDHEADDWARVRGVLREGRTPIQS